MLIATPVGHATRRRVAFVVALAMLLTAVPFGLPPASSQPLETRLVTVRGLESAAAATGGQLRSATGPRRSKPTATPMRFSMVAFEAPADSVVWFRTAHRGVWSDWQHAAFLPPDEGEEVSRGPIASTDPLWVRAADRLQVQVTRGAPEEVVVHLIDSSGLNRGFGGLAMSSLGSSAAEAATRPGMVTRAQWGADESLRRDEPDYAAPRLGIIHHTAGANDYTREESAAIVRGIYKYHVQARGWSDIGYNFLVDKYGQVFEGRYGGVDRGVIGAHAAGNNTGSFGVATIGNFEQAAAPAAMVDAVTRLVAWKFEVHGIDPRAGATTVQNGERLSRLSGHRDVGSTVCPGQGLYDRLGTIHGRLDALVAPGWTPVTGDWDGDGTDELGWFKDGDVALRMGDGKVVRFRYGRAGDIPIVGDWNNDGIDTLGIVRAGGEWHLINSHRGGSSDKKFTYGRVGSRGEDLPLVGDWNGNGQDTVGIVRDGEWHLRNTLSGGPGQIKFTYGRIGPRGDDLPLVGDWNGNGHDTVGIVRDGEWHLRNTLSGGSGQIKFTYGRVTRGDIPVVADWLGTDGDRPIIVRGSGWYLQDELAGGTADAFRAVPTPDAAQ